MPQLISFFFPVHPDDFSHQSGIIQSPRKPFLPNPWIKKIDRELRYIRSLVSSIPRDKNNLHLRVSFLTFEKPFVNSSLQYNFSSPGFKILEKYLQRLQNYNFNSV
ncbi:Uncharacterised protein at_DN2068 [Pycnogonum litorale]